ncbi:MAG: BrnT family toxin [Pseudomonadota bacterium]
MLLFEWDSAKAATNRKKHGVTFEEAATVFFDVHGFDLPDVKHSSRSERRAIRIGMSISTRILMSVYTERIGHHGEETIRIISARRANAKERGFYSGHVRF